MTNTLLELCRVNSFKTKGILYWDKSSIIYDQTKNAVEEINRKQRVEIYKRLLKELPKKYHNNIRWILSYYESCGVDAFALIMEGMGFLTTEMYPTLKTLTGDHQIQMDDWFMNFINDPKHNKLFAAGDHMDNRLIYSYPTMAKHFFNVKSIMFTKKKPLSFYKAAEMVYTGNGLQLCFKKPGHYRGVVAYDPKIDCLKYYDSWANAPDNEFGGKLENITKEEFDTNTIDYRLVYLK